MKPAILLLLPSIAMAGDIDSGGLEAIDSGMIIDNTITLIGHEFAREFSAQRLDADTSPATTFTITERPSARWGSMIIISEGQNTLQTLFITPGRMNVREIAAQVEETMEQRLAQNRLRKMIEAIELAPDELE